MGVETVTSRAAEMAYLGGMRRAGVLCLVALAAVGEGCTMSGRVDPIVVDRGSPATPRRAASARPHASAAPVAPVPALDTPQADPEASRQFLDGLSQPGSPLAVPM